MTSYEQGAAWKKRRSARSSTQLMDEKGIVIVTWIWQAGGVASRDKPILAPEDAKGMKVRGGSREMDMMFKAAGARCDAAVERDLRGDADRRDGRGDDLLDQPDLVPPRGDRQEPDHRAAASPTGSCSSRC